MNPQIITPKNWIYTVQYDPWNAMKHAKDNTLDFIKINFIFLGKMLTGKVSLKSLGGPITIFESAGTALNTSIITFTSFLAFLSIAIGVINIIPIPGLDGGYLLFYAIESITRRPLSEKWQALLFRLGFIVLMLLLVQAMINDLLRLQ